MNQRRLKIVSIINQPEHHGDAELVVYRTVWTPAPQESPVQGERERRRRRQRLLGIRGPAFSKAEIFRSDLLSAIAEALAEEYPQTLVFGRKAA